MRTGIIGSLMLPWQVLVAPWTRRRPAAAAAGLLERRLSDGSEPLGVDEDVVDADVAAALAPEGGEAHRHATHGVALAAEVGLEVDVVAETPSQARVGP